jgi:hypothetical protein
VKRVALILMLAAAALAPAFSEASTLVGQSVLVLGSEAQAVAINVPSAGELSLQLTDVNFTSPFSSLMFALTDSSTDFVPLTDAGTMSLAVPGPVTLYAHVFARAQGGFDVGMYNFTASFVPGSPVPLPGTGPLMGMILALALLARLPRRLGRCADGSAGKAGAAI